MTIRLTRTLALAILATCLSLGGLVATADAETCSKDDIARAVDRSGAKLRAFSLEAQPQLRDRIRRYAETTKTSAETEEDAALDAIQDPTLKELDEKSAALLLRVDGLGRIDDKTAPDCGRLKEIESASGELLSVMRTKSDYMLARLDQKIVQAGGTAAPPQTTAPAPQSAPPIKPDIIAKAPEPAAEKPAILKPTEKVTEAKPTEAKPRDTDKPAKPEPKPEAKLDAPKPKQWSTTEKPNDAYVPPPAPADIPAAVAEPQLTDDGYSVDEIREATRGFFGTISTNLASVIEHAFKTSGRPTAYILGTEGGGAFFAGLRIGEGQLFMRDRSDVRDVHWHGPSLGTDFGASGSRTMFLIYKMRDPSGLYRSFTGIDGSAYVIGGVGVTLLKGGDVIMAPIRSGLGLRVGANIGYVRFTDQPTWNPF